MLPLLLLTAARGGVPVALRLVNENGIRWAHYAPAHKGADPGEAAYLRLRFDGGGGLAPPEHSQFAAEGTDLLYLGEHVARVPVAAAEDVGVGPAALAALTDVWGMCDGVLHLGRLPRRCRVGATGVVACDAATTCASTVAFDAAQHRGPCNATVAVGDIAVRLDCAATVAVEATRIPAVVEGAAAVVSVHQAKLAWEYDAATGRLRLWQRPARGDDRPAMVVLAVALLFLAAWQGWAHRATAAVVAGRGIDTVWQDLGAYARTIGDVPWWTAVAAFGVRWPGSLPDQADEVLGDGAAEQCTVLLAAGLFAVLLGTWPVLLAAADGAWAARWLPRLTAGLAARRRAAVVGVRWGVDVVMLVSLVLLLPDSHGTSFHRVSSFVTGVVLAVVSGRDATLLVAVGGPRVLAAAGLTAAVAHTTLFMLFPALADLRPRSAAPLGVALGLALQCAAAGACWALRQPWPGTPPGRGGRAPPSPRCHF